MSDREEFEKWAHQEGLDLTLWTIDYFTTLTNGAFKGWNARQPEIDALKQQKYILQDYWNRAQRDLAKQQNEIAALKVENERLRKDAERYLWLRFADDEQLAKVRAFGTHDEAGVSWLPEGEAFDKAIDAAMKETK